MIAETTINLYPIFKFILYLLAVFGGFYFINTIAHLLSNKHTVDKFINKYPDVTEIFCKLPIREQNIENNQEIHELNQITNDILKRLDALEKRLKNG